MTNISTEFKTASVTLDLESPRKPGRSDAEVNFIAHADAQNNLIRQRDYTRGILKLARLQPATPENLAVTRALESRITRLSTDLKTFKMPAKPSSFRRYWENQ